MKKDYSKELRGVRSDKKNNEVFRAANLLYTSGACYILSQGKDASELMVQDEELAGEEVFRIAMQGVR